MRRSALVVLALFGLATVPAWASATIVIQNNNGAGVGFNDPTPVAPVGNNPGTTLGQQRLNAFNAAAAIWGQQINSTITIIVRAQFVALTCTANSAVLGSAGTITIHRDFANAPLSGTWYHQALANSLAHSDLSATEPDISANFNVNLGNPGCLTGIPFYLGIDNNAPANSVDLVTVLLHEFGHGLGFSTFVNGSTGVENGGFDDAFETHLVDRTTGGVWSQMNNAQRAASAINTRNVAWDGIETEVAAPTSLGLGQALLNVTAPVAREFYVSPATFGPPVDAAIQAGVVVGLDAGASSQGCNAIVTNLNGKIALLDAGGACTFTAKVKRAQTAGAVAVLIANDASTPGSHLVPLDGSDGTITIPSARITLDDGAFLKANIAGLTATLKLDDDRRRGTDDSGRPFTYNPGTFSPGSSVSHWDTMASPNLLMEPSLNSDLGHDLDLTLAVFRDLGWSTVNTTPTPTLSVNDVAVTEGNSGTTNAVFTVSLSAPSVNTVTVQYATAPGTAVSPADFTALALNTLTFEPGETSKPVTVKVKGDTKDEDNETYFLNLSNPTVADLADNQGVGTINDNDPLPALSIANVTTAEGSSNKMLTLTVKLTPASGRTVTVNYATANGSATAGSDYTTASGTLTFDPGQTSKTFKVTINGDHTFEPNETFTVALSAPSNATASGPATVTLTNDDDAPVPVSASINNVSAAEGNSGSASFVFTVTLSAAPTSAVSLSYATANGTGVAPGDYTSKTGTLSFNAGQTSKTLSVPVKGDTSQEANETFFVNLSAPVGMTISDNQGLGTIQNDDAPTLSIADKSVTEGNSGQKNLSFTVTLSGAALNTVTVQAQTAAGTATAGVDYTETSGTVTFTAGQTSRTFVVPVKGDALDENDETFVVNLSAPTNATIADGQATGTIVDNE